MTPQWSLGTKGRRYLYYVSQAYLQRRKATAGSLPRVSAALIEEIVLRCVGAIQPNTQRSPRRDVDARASQLLGNRSDLATSIRTFVAKIVVKAEEVVVELNDVAAMHVPEDKAAIQLTHIQAQLPVGASVMRTEHGVQVTLPGRLKRRGGIKRIEGWNRQDWSVVTPCHDKTLLAALGRAHRWCEAIERGKVPGIEALADREKLNRRQVSRLLRLAFLAPDIQRAIVEGRQPIGFNLKWLIEHMLPAAWTLQRRELGLGNEP